MLNKKNLTLYTSFELPLNPELSKNRRYGGKTAKFISNKHRAARKEVTMACLQAITRDYCKALPAKCKLWVDMHVYKQSHRQDATNFIDDTLDAIEEIIGVNDRYYSVCCDWSINRKNPTLKVKIYVESFNLDNIEVHW